MEINPHEIMLNSWISALWAYSSRWPFEAKLSFFLSKCRQVEGGRMMIKCGQGTYFWNSFLCSTCFSPLTCLSILDVLMVMPASVLSLWWWYGMPNLCFRDQHRGNHFKLGGKRKGRGSRRHVGKPERMILLGLKILRICEISMRNILRTWWHAHSSIV